MAYNFFGDQRDQPWRSHWSRQNNLANAPFSFNNRKYYSNYFNVNRRSEPPIHHHRPTNYFSPSPPPTPPPPQSTTNMLSQQYIAMSGRLNGSKAKLRFHGGIGDGRGGLACRMPQESASPQLIKLFDELNPIDVLIKAPSVGSLENHVARAPTLSSEASNGTGVFLPMYPKKMRFEKGMHSGNGGCWNEIRDVTKGKELTEEEATPTPVELMLSGDTSHVM